MKTAILGTLALLLQLYKIYKLRQITKFYRLLIKKITSMEILSIKQLKDKVIEGVYEIGEYVLVQGQITSQDRTMRSLLDQKKMVVYSQMFMDKVFQIGDSRNTVRKRMRRLVSGLLKLTDGTNSINIFQTFNTKFFTSNFMKKTKSYKQKIFNFGWLFSVLLKSPTRVISNNYTQYLIPYGAKVTVLAQGPISSPNYQFNISQPIMIAGSKARILLYYQGKLQHDTIIMIMMCALALLTTYILFKLFLKPWIIQSRPLAKKSQINHIQQIQVKDRNCSRCKTVLSNIIYSPCGHLVICSDCNSLQKVCVECDKQPKDKIVVYPC